MKKHYLASALLLGTACFWGVSFVAQVLGARYMDTATFNAARFLVGAAVLVPVCLLFERERPDRRRARRTALGALCAGVMLFLASFLQQYGTGLSANPGKAGFITGLYTVLTPVLYFVFFRQRTGLQNWLGAALAAVGLYLLCFDGTAGLAVGTAELVLLAGAVFWAGHILVIGRFVADVSPFRFACGQFLLCGLLNLALSLLNGPPDWQGIRQGLGPILFCGLLSTGVGFTVQVVGQKLAADPTRAAILLSTESLFSALGGAIWNRLPIPPAWRVDASMNIYGAVGCAVIFVAIVLAQLPARSARTAHSTSGRHGRTG